MSQTQTPAAAALRWIGKARMHLDENELAVLEQVEQRRALTTKLHDQDEAATFGERLADSVASFGGSWRFILIFTGLLLAWTVFNTELLGRTAFDPYPYIFLNLLLSMTAALQAPVIMMSQNRQNARDRQSAESDYAVNLKAEIEIMALHEKFDAMRTDQIIALLERQQAQIEELTLLVRGQTIG
ncbi:MAG: rane protein [Hydrocarboniphaga sp.]|uniref:DUF1003 domain-containing protein n=1 Tax=Hydrocarboniphaga sp. TaxID=2033016 RepID=UPI00262319FF|nr:DUF1003 domain-containing protein [Hydrocarboniphaga sp.]MDB5971043.1 rane protein [Hydrocarboniphaga sp.]